MKRFYPILLALVLAAGALCQLGCQTYEKLALHDEKRLANDRFKQKRYLVARAMYRRLIDKYPEGETRQQMMLQIGRCFFNDQVRSLHDARMAYMEYLEAYPNGLYAAEAKESIKRIDNLQIFRKTTFEARMGNLARRIEEIQKQIEKDPANANLYDNAELHYQLGNALWKLQRYDEAFEAYLKSRELNPEFKENEVINRRITQDEDGNIIPLTPDVARAQAIERKPLVVFDVYAYNSRLAEDFLSAREVYFNVQGLVRNQSSRTLRGVIVEVRFLNAARQQLDFRRESIGRMPPGAIRAFGVQSSRYDDIYNISSYECFAYER